MRPSFQPPEDDDPRDDDQRANPTPVWSEDHRQLVPMTVAEAMRLFLSNAHDQRMVHEALIANTMTPPP